MRAIFFYSILLYSVATQFLACTAASSPPNTAINLQQDLYPIRSNHKWGYINYINGKANTVILPQYDSVLYRYQGNYLVLTNKKEWRALQANGKLSDQIFQSPIDTAFNTPSWDEIEPYYELTPISVGCEQGNDCRTKYVDKKGKLRFTVVGRGSVFCKEGYALINTIFAPHDYLVKVQNYVIDTLGHKRFDIPNRGFIKPFKGKTAVWDTNDSYRHGLLNEKGDIVLSDSYQSIVLLNTERAMVLDFRPNKRLGVGGSKFALFSVNKRMFITDFIFDDLDREGFKPNLIQGKINNKMVYLNRDGKIVWQEA